MFYTQHYLLVVYTILILLLLVIYPNHIESRRTFTQLIKDDYPINSEILNLQKEMNLNDPNIKFSILKTSSKAKQYFKIQNKILYTKDVIDLDSMCDKVGECCNDNMDSVGYARVKQSCDIKLTISYFLNDVHMIDVVITIEDQNDHIPRFVEGNFDSGGKGNNPRVLKEKTIKIQEDTKKGYIIKLPRATDYDYSSGNLLKYTISSFKPPLAQSIFQLIDKDTSRSRDKNLFSSPALRLRENLDREEIPFYTFILSASDITQNPSYKTGSVTITIQVEDVNDNYPQFKNKIYTVRRPEGAYSPKSMLTLQAEDRDKGTNAVIEYLMNPDRTNKDARKYFRVEMMTGEVFQIAALDYERNKMIEFEVIALNKVPIVSINNNNLNYYPSSTTSTATITVTITNRYDEQLKIVVDYFKNSNFTSVIENKDDNHLALISVQNPDSIPLNIRCRIDDIWNHYFKLNRKQSEKNYYVLKQYRKLDREKNPIVKFYVICSHPHPTSGNNIDIKKAIEIHVKDENDNPPKFKNIVEGSRVDVWENSPVGNVVCKITAEDPDEGDNGKVIYSLSKSDSRVHIHMQINENNGYITIQKPMDREQLKDSYQGDFIEDDNEAILPVIVTAKDRGNPSLTSQMTFNVVVLDVNDNEPYFRSEPMFFKVKENLKAGVTVGTFQVLDPDINDTINVKVRGHSPFKIIRLPNRDNNRISREFEVQTTQRLDCEKKNQYDLTVHAIDRPRNSQRRYMKNRNRKRFGMPISGKMHIEVEDENDVAPIFRMPSPGNNTVFKISYQEPVGHEIFDVYASDKDHSTQNNQLTYSVKTIDYPNRKSPRISLNNDDSVYMPILNVDSYTKKVTTIRSMSLRDIGSHEFKFTATDNGIPSLSGTTCVTVTVINSPSQTRDFNDLRKKNENEIANSRHKNNVGDGGQTGNYNLIIIVIVIVFVLVIIVIFFLFFCLPKNCLHGNNTSRNNNNVSASKQQQQQQHCFVNNHNNTMLGPNNKKMMSISSNETQFMNQPNLVAENMNAINSYPHNEEGKYMATLSATSPKFSQQQQAQFGPTGNKYEYMKLNSPDLFPQHFYTQPGNDMNMQHQNSAIYQTIAELQSPPANAGMHSPSFSLGPSKRQRQPSYNMYRTFEGIRYDPKGAATFYPGDKGLPDGVQLIHPGYQSEQQLWQPSSNHQFQTNHKQDFLLDESCDPENMKNQSDNLSCFNNNNINNLDAKSDIQGIQAFAKDKPQDESSFV